MMKMDDIRHGFEALRDSVSEGWGRLRESAAGALTRFRPGVRSATPQRGDGDDALFLARPEWALLGGEVFEDDARLVVRIEAPGMDKEDFDIEVRGDSLVVRGEKRFERESSEGRWRVLQCAYGTFDRVIPLPAPVRIDAAKASYRRGVLKIELPKAVPSTPRATTIKVA